MPQRSIASRVEILEEKVTSFEELPARVERLESQIQQFRDEVRREFSAIRVEMTAGLSSTVATLRDEMRAGDEETRRYMRVLHEEVLARIAIIGEPRRAGRKRR